MILLQRPEKSITHESSGGFSSHMDTNANLFELSTLRVPLAKRKHFDGP